MIFCYDAIYRLTAIKNTQFAVKNPQRRWISDVHPEYDLSYSKNILLSSQEFLPIYSALTLLLG